jgi:tetratricopeptide (TPR) repeat protein
MKLQATPDISLQVCQRHAEYFLRLAQGYACKIRTPEEARVLQQFKTNLENVRAAMDWAQRERRDQCCAELALALVPLLSLGGFQEEAIRRVQRGLEALHQRQEKHPALYAGLLRERAGLHLDQFEWAKARQCAEEALALLGPLKDLQEQARASNLLGQAAAGEKKFPEARHHYESALRHFQKMGHTVGRAIVHINLGLVEYYDESSGDQGKALHHGQEALRLSRQNGDKRGLAQALNNLGMVAQKQENWGEAWERYDESLGIEREMRRPFGVGRALFNLGEVAELRGDLKPAYRLFAAAECLFGKIGSLYRAHASEKVVQVGSRLECQEAQTEELRRSLKSKSLNSLIQWALPSHPW